MRWLLVQQSKFLWQSTAQTPLRWFSDVITIMSKKKRQRLGETMLSACKTVAATRDITPRFNLLVATIQQQKSHWKYPMFYAVCDPVWLHIRTVCVLLFCIWHCKHKCSYQFFWINATYSNIPAVYTHTERSFFMMTTLHMTKEFEGTANCDPALIWLGNTGLCIIIFT